MLVGSTFFIFLQLPNKWYNIILLGGGSSLKVTLCSTPASPNLLVASFDAPHLSSTSWWEFVGVNVREEVWPSPDELTTVLALAVTSTPSRVHFSVAFGTAPVTLQMTVFGVLTAPMTKSPIDWDGGRKSLSNYIIGILEISASKNAKKVLKKDSKST